MVTVHGTETADGPSSPYPPPPLPSAYGDRPERPATAPGRTAMAALGVAIVLLLGGGVAGVVTNSESDSETLVMADDFGSSDTEAGATPAPASVPDGWRTYGGKLEGYTIALPPGWTTLPLDSDTLGEVMDQMAKANPRLASALDEQVRQALDEGGKLFAFQTSSDGAVNINLIATPSGGARLSDIKEVLPVELTDAGAKNMRSETVTTPSGQALKLTYTLSLRATPRGPMVNIEQTQYVFVHGRQAYILTVSTPNRGRDGATLDQIAGTLSF